MNHPAIELMRRHDYYLGWLDCIQTTYMKEHADIFSNHPRLVDKQEPRNAFNAGANIGALFCWVLLCTEERAEWAVRLSNTAPTWTHLKAYNDTVFDGPNGDFWRGVEHGEEIARARFAEESAKDV